jgi:murein DD-endopeptidase MepM/ murein hydrolase activator NlpD
MLRIIIYLLLLQITSISWAKEYDSLKALGWDAYIEPVAGGIVRVPLNIHSETIPHIQYQKKRVLVMRQEGDWLAVVGLDLKTKAKQQQLRDVKTGAVYHFKVSKKVYEEQHIQLKNKREVNPNKKDLQRIAKESKRIRKALKHTWRSWVGAPALPLTQPVQGRYSSPFGLKRFFNGQQRKPHRGLDIAAPTGTAIQAPADAIVIQTGHYFFNGKSVFLDHGQGLISFYCHLDEIQAMAGQRLQRGQILGKVGSTGRATGAHLHWGVRLNGHWIDPLSLLE